MSRAHRLLDLIQALRRHRRPVIGRALAEELGVSVRTLYRDIATLQGQGAPIEGEPGVGYVLRPGFMLPPLMFAAEEIEALALGSRFVAQRGDARLAAAARNAIARIAAVLPDDLRHQLETTGLLIGPPDVDGENGVDLAQVRDAIRREQRLAIVYRDADGATTQRTIWPLALSFFDRVRVLIGWCEMRQDFRHFRADRIDTLTLAGARYPRRRNALLKEWRAREGIPEPDEGASTADRN